MITQMSKSAFIRLTTLSTSLSLGISLGLYLPQQAHAQFGGEISQLADSETLDLAADSPFRDPNVIYLEADELINNDQDGSLTARGQVEGRYQDRTLRADEVIYFIEEGLVIASGNVILVDASGVTQFADKLELSNRLEAGTAANFTARTPTGGITAARFATRGEDEAIELYNAYYTACEVCEAGDRPTWRIRARKVRQDKEQNSIKYRDAVFEFLGVPFLYTPYLAHPDPTADRASGWLTPLVGISSSRGGEIEAPYYLALSSSSELTVTPRIFTDVRPLVEYDYRKRFHTGEINLSGSFTYANFFDDDGNTFGPDDVFLQPEEAPLGERLRSHTFANGFFNLGDSDVWTLGFGVEAATDDLFLDRYGLTENPESFGLYEADGRRLITQTFLNGISESLRFNVAAFGFQSLRTSINRDANDPNLISITREDDSLLPIIAPKIELNKYFQDPLVKGRLNVFGDFTALTRDIGTDYLRATGGANWNKTFIAPGGIEVKPFGEGRFDYFEIDPDTQDINVNNLQDFEQFNFSRTIGQTGVDIRWPFIRSQKGLDIIIEPRAQVTQSFGDGELDNFTTLDLNGNPVFLQQDSTDIDLDQSLFWQANKSTGFDFWQKGFRADIGASVSADWGGGDASLFVGQSYANGFDDSFALGSGLEGDKSDIIGLFELNLGRKISTRTRLRFDDDTGAFRRIDTGFNYRGNRLSFDARYFRIDPATLALSSDPTLPPQEISGSLTYKWFDNWSTRYRAFRDIDLGEFRRQEVSLIYDDDCTRIELIYSENNNNQGIVGNNRGFSIRVSLLTLGQFGSSDPTRRQSRRGG